MIATRAAELPLTLDDRGESTTLATSSCWTSTESGAVLASVGQKTPSGGWEFAGDLPRS